MRVLLLLIVCLFAVISCNDDRKCPDILISDNDSTDELHYLALLAPISGDTLDVSLPHDVVVSFVPTLNVSTFEWVELGFGVRKTVYYDPIDSSVVTFPVGLQSGTRYYFVRVITTASDTLATPQIVLTAQ